MGTPARVDTRLQSIDEVQADPTPVTDSDGVELIVRQVMTMPVPLAPTSSFDYWWPYPAWGASTSTTTTPATIVGPASATVVSSTSLVTALRPALTTSSTSATAWPSSDASVIHVSALPPANSSSSSQNAQDISSRSSSFNIAYLAPLFAILGALFGSLCAWFVLRWLARRRGRKVHAPLLKPGPRYVQPPETEMWGGGRQPSGLVQGIHTRSGEKPMGSSRHSQLERPRQGAEEGTSMLRSQPSSTTKQTPAAACLGHPQMSSCISSSASAQGNACFEGDPFLPHADGARKPATAMSENRFIAALTSPGILSDEEDYDPDTLRHKSIRRGILERLKLGTLRRPAKRDRDRDEEDVDVQSRGALPDGSPTKRVSHRHGHKRKDSDCNVNEMRCPPMAMARVSSSIASPSPRRGLSRGSQYSVDVDSPLLHSPGFRIIEEDTEADALATSARGQHQAHGSGAETKSSLGWQWLSPWSASPARSPGADVDTYTTLPTRRSAATGERRNDSPSPFAMTSAVHNAVASPAIVPAMPRIDSSILPSSPPRIMSPPLESKLFFGAISPNFGSTPALDLQLPVEGPRPRPVASPPEPEPALVRRQRNKLHTRKNEPALPFPSSAASSPYRNRLKKSTVPSASTPSSDCLSQDAAAQWRSPAVRHAAFEKVDEIVSRSWSQRDITLDVFVGSPMHFGAVVADALGSVQVDAYDGVSTNAVGTGIHQRLETLKAKERES